MQPTPDIDFYIKRERQERSLADRARHAEGRRVHLEMAERYARLIAETSDRSRPTLTIRMPQ